MLRPLCMLAETMGAITLHCMSVASTPTRRGRPPGSNAARASNGAGSETAAAIPAGATPAMAQWFVLKNQHPDALLFFRMGDFYELFFQDAENAAATLDIQLTKRGLHEGEPIPMCGVPVHAAEMYLSRLIRRGWRVAIVEQMENPKNRAGKGPIRRDVVRLVTPGTITEETLLDAGRPNLLLAIAQSGNHLGAAWLDISTGLFETESLDESGLTALLGRLDPAEILCPSSLHLEIWDARRGPEQPVSDPANARARLAEAYDVSHINVFGSFTDAEAMAAMQALDYVRDAQMGALPRLGHPVPVGEAGRLAMDASTRASLEIDRARDGGTERTLLSAVQRTLTPAGGRMLAAWLGAPLTDRTVITARQDGWGWLLEQPTLSMRLRETLRGCPDMARALGRIALGRGTPRDLAAIRDGAHIAMEAAGLLEGILPSALAELHAALHLPPDLPEMLEAALADPVPARIEDGGVIASGFDGELDAERGLRDDSRKVIAALQTEYAQRYGVASLKIRHHAQLGYMIEVPAVAVETLRTVPELILRQGMANGARFTHPDLSELDRRITEAAERARQREMIVITALRQKVEAHSSSIAACAEALARLDVLQSAARLAENGTWCRPVMTDDQTLTIEAGRHPVVEAALEGGPTPFMPNDTDLSASRRVMLLTGPNMAGKSTYLRQNALIVILAQAGLPVPARAAHIGIVDRLFSRVGASDDLARGQSTFMVEMTETAAILHQAGPRSLVVVDEIGRGTSTLDGLAIAWAVLEALHSRIGARTIFATHFHELARLQGELPMLRPYTMKVQEWRGKVVFLHEVAEGAGGRSWGVHVAKLAGVPAATVRRAGQLLTALEERSAGLTDNATLPLFAASHGNETETEPAEGIHEAKPASLPQELIEALGQMEPDKLTPREALDLIYHFKSMLSSQAHNGDVEAESW
ncbi:DNA mismatch repair protein mutS [Granulibacter bethesdensis]|uniref:DNA mismatch repair protein MutS n=2 Tax=Granulibacter bethesdensis TaxID=364410 RepID=A0AAN0RC60_9PROT|nr:DNA mismatch repair protein mutS [Granulibacter bethesdensis]